ncbi:hypothetical protein IQ266_24025 [filamentous cyanobacterium LEGE 11480]|uniref:Avidin family protein n=1 Tax=Romeriopsis navalis LEGE 11480 TaxID=2777977 RepID=A0A928Z6N1_9CYAN|nr:hypothetical protein [Romeriopsis navalis]MBE9032808.1 hypothetical protein [Romeriopsis navalis LEGE 11480]
MTTDLSGTWLGTYWHNGEPTRFEATLVQGGNGLSGRMQDDGPLGEAQVVGDIVGRKVSFSKTYIGAQSHSIDYAGTISEEGDSISGSWIIRGTRHSGNWEAKRGGDDLMQQLRRRMEQQTPVGAK